MNEENESRNAQWYDTSCGAAHPESQIQTQPAAAAPHPTQLPPRRSAGEVPAGEGSGKRGHGSLRAVAVCLLAVVLIAATSLAFSGGGEGGRVSWPQLSTGGEPSFEDYDDYREFFNGYYENTSGSLGGSSIPRAEAAGELRLEPVPEPETEELTYQEIYEKCSPSVVGITAMVSDMSYYWGTGIVISEDGYIATNAHIIEGAYSATVTLWNDREYEALLVGIDSVSDLAVLKIEAEGLTAAEFCSAQVSVGDSVVAIGNPLGAELRGTMTDGIISAISRDIPYNNHSMTLLQTNAAINDGNSGGPLINMHGQVVGITNMKMKAATSSATAIEGIGFAIPVKTIASVVDELIASGSVSGRPALGVTVGVIPASAAEYFGIPEGLYVIGVADGSDAKTKGIRQGDIIVEVNGDEVYDTEDLSRAISEYDVGTLMTLKIYRDGETMFVNVELVETSDIY